MRRVVIVGASLAGLRAARLLEPEGSTASWSWSARRPSAVHAAAAVEGAPGRRARGGTRRAPVGHLRRAVAARRARDEARPRPPASRARRRRRAFVRPADPRHRVQGATLARPRRRAGGLHVLRSLDDALALRTELERRPRVVVVGAGFIGCEVAQTARKQGLDVTLIDIAPTPMLPLGPQLGEWCAALHRDNGVDVRLRTGVAALHGAGRIEAVELTDGTRSKPTSSSLGWARSRTRSGWRTAGCG